MPRDLLAVAAYGGLAAFAAALLVASWTALGPPTRLARTIVRAFTVIAAACLLVAVGSSAWLVVSRP